MDAPASGTMPPAEDMIGAGADAGAEGGLVIEVAGEGVADGDSDWDEVGHGRFGGRHWHSYEKYQTLSVKML